MKKLIFIISLIIFCSPVFKGYSQESNNGKEVSHFVGITVPDVALIGIEGPEGNEPSINLTPDISGLEAGEKIDFGTATNNSLWLNYTSLVEKQENGNGQGKTRKIKAELEENLPNGMELFLEVGPANSGGGQTGKAKQEKIPLKKGPSIVVENIGSCFTENGEGKGHRLTYSLGVKENQIDMVMAETFSVQVLYTITEN
ncbi:hypothetical protein [Mariniphaga sp.]|uniref:hypothetical protein n=1 Tax=Mariniphaga sp. TaxID=1954475 RepID=UPI003563717A